jgi:hypothetical protein
MAAALQLLYELSVRVIFRWEQQADKAQSA